jgi:hypothetical protein
MSFSFLKQLHEAQELQLLESAADVAELKNTQEYKTLKAKHPKVADAIELQWGYPEFNTYAQKALDSVKTKKGDFANMDNESVSSLAKLVSKHGQKYPELKKQADKSPTNYRWDDENTDVRTTR